MSRPTSPQARDTNQGRSWTWKTWRGVPDPVTGEVREEEVELEWLTEIEAWKVRRRYDRAGWSPAQTVTDLADPETWEHADALAQEYADRLH